MSTEQSIGKQKEKNQHIKVFVRVRPLNVSETVTKSAAIIECSSKKDVLIRERPSDKQTKKFTFDRTFGPNSTQIDVYKDVVGPLINEVLAGYNCTVFAYGQTGTGKTFTMEGERSDDPSIAWHMDPQIGIIPRAMSHLFNELRILQFEYSVRVSFLELYNEELFDLLSPVNDSTKLKLFEDATKKGAVIVSGLEEVAVHNKNEVYQILEKGSLKRQTAATLMNANSSRSHTIFSITVHMKEDSIEGDELIKIGKLNLVDLAGSENIGRSGAVDKRAREAGNINQSLLTLGRVITALAERTRHIPYRESKLTRLLQESLGGRTKTSIIATVSPALCNIEESLSTLDYANRAKSITIRPEINQKLSKKALIKEYTEEIDRLRRDLQATRDRNGIFLAAENYEEMLTQISSQKTEMAQLIVNVKTLEQFIDTKNTLNLELSKNLQTYKDRLQETEVSLVEMNKLLNETEADRSEKAYLLQQHFETESKLSEQARKLLVVAEESTSQSVHLHNSLERKRLLESKNSSVCTSFQDLVKGNLAKVEQSITHFSLDVVGAADSLKHRLGESYKTAVNISNDMASKISTMVNGQIQIVTDMDHITAEMSHTQEFVKELSSSVKETCVATTRDLQHSARNIQEEIAALHRQNLLLRGEINNMRKIMDSEIEANMQRMCDFTTNHMCELRKGSNEVLQMVQELNQQRKTIAKGQMNLSQSQTNYTQEMKQNMQITMNKYKSYCATTGNSLSHLHDTVSMQQEMSNSLTIKLTAGVDHVLQNAVEFNTDYKTSVEGLKEVTNLFADESVSVLDGVNQSGMSLAGNVENMVSSASNHWQEHTDKLNSDFQTISSTLAVIEERQHKRNMDLASTLEDSIPVHRDIQENQIHDMSSLVTSCMGDLDLHCVQVGDMQDTVQTDIGHIQSLCDKFIQQDLQSYVATGRTPERQEFSYPRDLAATSPHDRLVNRFRLLNGRNIVLDEETSSEISQAEEIEEKENSRFIAPVVSKPVKINEQRAVRSALSESSINQI